MRYNDRVKIITNQKVDNGGWDDEVKPITSDWLPCRITGVSQAMNMGVFGKYDSNALAVHFKNKVEQVDYVFYKEVQRKPQAVIQARHNTVVIIGSV
ncbi:hypothetical protein [Leuconostoc mesenteroides]|uniref:hypothetical protein n=1 Tax=Leuconostoc mesenteroides TaxID=1245 RepID=UPI00235FA710|nr:hypothetical protein [Leuconostoc mesenteroides]